MLAHFFAYPHPDRVMPCHDLLFMLRGSWEVMEEDQCFLLEAGSALFLFAGRHHFGKLPCSADAEWIYLHINSDPQDRYLIQLSNTSTDTESIYLPQCVDVKNDMPAFRALFQQVLRLNTQFHSLSKTKATLACTSLLIELAQHAQREQSGQDLAMEELAVYLERTLHKNHSLVELAQHTGISERMLTKRFKQHMQATIFDYVFEIRMQKARTLIENYPAMRLKEMAYSLGFYDEYHFSRAFKSFFGYGPRAYRKRKE
jgi:AraC-like DNA-binding protein